MTSGNCYEPIDGSNIASLYLPNQYNNLAAAYYEGIIVIIIYFLLLLLLLLLGSHYNNYAASHIVFTILTNLTLNTDYYIFIDRSNRLRRYYYCYY